jgi:hypothetical protein
MSLTTFMPASAESVPRSGGKVLLSTLHQPKLRLLPWWPMQSLATLSGTATMVRPAIASPVAVGIWVSSAFSLPNWKVIAAISASCPVVTWHRAFPLMLRASARACEPAPWSGSELASWTCSSKARSALSWADLASDSARSHAKVYRGSVWVWKVSATSANVLSAIAALSDMRLNRVD